MEKETTTAGGDQGRDRFRFRQQIRHTMRALLLTQADSPHHDLDQLITNGVLRYLLAKSTRPVYPSGEYPQDVIDQ
jgi:hypothetical protein